MNVIFIDFDGALDTVHYNSNEDIERRIKILSDICKEYDCKVVIEASAKVGLDEETMEIIYPDSKFLKFILDCFKKYDIDCIGRTPTVSIIKSCGGGGRTIIPIWKEHEIRLYLFRHPEIDHYCVIDDDDGVFYGGSDLNKVRNHLVKTEYYSHNPEEEGLLEKHKEEVGRILKEENEIKKFALKRKQRKNIL